MRIQAAFNLFFSASALQNSFCISEMTGLTTRSIVFGEQKKSASARRDAPGGLDTRTLLLPETTFHALGRMVSYMLCISDPDIAAMDISSNAFKGVNDFADQNNAKPRITVERRRRRGISLLRESFKRHHRPRRS